MKYKIHTKAIDGGPFSCRPAGEWELEDDKILCNDVHLPDGGFNPHMVSLWVIGNEYGPVCAVWASCGQGALDEMVDAGLGDSFLVPQEDIDSATEEEREEWASLGNAGEYADLTYCWMAQAELQPERDIQLIIAFAEARGAGQKTLFS